jgi:hypothetical protein
MIKRAKYVLMSASVPSKCKCKDGTSCSQLWSGKPRSRHYQLVHWKCAQWVQGNKQDPWRIPAYQVLCRLTEVYRRFGGISAELVPDYASQKTAVISYRRENLTSNNIHNFVLRNVTLLYLNITVTYFPVSYPAHNRERSKILRNYSVYLSALTAVKAIE